MTHNESEHIYHESREAEGGCKPDGLKVRETTELEVFTEEVSEMLEKISHNDCITMGDMRAFKTALEAIRVSTGVETAPLATFEESDEWKRNAEICKSFEAGNFLLITQLTFITSKIATLISEADYLNFENTSSLTPVAARALGNHKGELDLHGLKMLSTEIASALIPHKGYLKLGGLTSLSAEVANALGQRKGGGLSLIGITELSPEAAQGLGNYEGELNLNGLSSLSSEVAEGLANHKGKLVISESLHQLSPEAASALSRHRGDILLWGLDKDVSEETLQALAHHTEGKIFIKKELERKIWMYKRTLKRTT